MMITKTRNKNQLTLALEGRLDTTTAPLLEQESTLSMQDITVLILEISELEYLSSAGLRVILLLQKQMQAPKSMIVAGVRPTIMEVFDMTGFSDILTFE